MSKQWRFLTVLVAALALIIGACSDDESPSGDDDTGADVGGDTGGDAGGDMLPDEGGGDMLPDEGVDVADEEVSAPTDFVTATFSIDDSVNQSYTDESGLAWKGSFNYDSETNIAQLDAAWGGPYPLLFDDGPISEGGHEPEGATADDSIWSVAVQIAITGEDINFEYGAIRGSVDGADNPAGWIWSGPNGTFTVPADAVDGDVIDAEGLIIEPFGWIDLRFTLDGTAISDDFATEAPTAVNIKSSAWGWGEIAMDDEDADDVWTFVLSDNVGEGTDNPHSGLLKAGDQPQFVFVLDGVEYKVSNVPPTDGVTVEYDLYGTWTEVTVTNLPDGDQNTIVDVPFAPVRNTAIVHFCIDDTANASYTADDGLAWKGSFDWDPDARLLSLDAAWGVPYPAVYDDGPWNEGGHEPAGATADDNVWCLAAFVEIPDADSTDFEYGAIRGSVDGSDGEWIWGLEHGSNGTFSVASTAAEGDVIDVTNLTIPAWGTIDARWMLDGTSIDEGFATEAPAVVELKSSAWAWSLITLTETGADTDMWEMTLSDHVGEGTDRTNTGLLNFGDQPQFVFVLDGVEYKVGGAAATAGVSAEIDTDGDETFESVTIEVQSEGDLNTFFTVPAAQ